MKTFLLSLTLLGLTGYGGNNIPTPTPTTDPCQILLKTAPPGATCSTIPVLPPINL